MNDPLMQKTKELFMTVSQGAVGLSVSIFVLVIVERAYGETGLGVFSFLLSLYIISGIVAAFGIAGFVERETAVNGENRQSVAPMAMSALFFLGLFFAALFIFTAAFDIAFTRVNEKLAAYIIIAFTLPLRNLNQLRIAILQGNGHHEKAALLQLRRHLTFIATFLILVLVRMPVSCLVLGFLAGEAGQMFLVRKHTRLPAISSLWRHIRTVPWILKQGYPYIIADEALSMVFYMDFLILGIFVSSWDLGVYAEAAVLAKIFLLIPLCLKPVFRKNCCDQAALHSDESLAADARRASAWTFFIHAVIGLYFLIYYPLVIDNLFHFHGKKEISFMLFSMLFPGLLYFSAVIPKEPVYEAVDRAGALQRIVILITALNIILNFYAIPFAGYYGAAFSTAATLLIYFFVFDWYLEPIHKTGRRIYIIAGAAIYLLYRFFHFVDITIGIGFWLIPAALFLVMVLIGFFDINDRKTDKESSHGKSKHHRKTA